MKSVLNFQIPLEAHLSLANTRTFQTVIKQLRDRLSEHYEIIITPFQLQADNMVSVIITPDCDLDQILRKLQNLSARDEYGYHMKYMPSSVYHTLDYDGDENVHPLDVMNEYWYPVIKMVDYTDLPYSDILKFLKQKDINPFIISAIIKDDIGIKIEFNKLMNSIKNHNDLHNDYILWMLETINNSSNETSEVYKQIVTAGVNPMLVINIKDNDDGFTFELINENDFDISKNSPGTYAKAALLRKANRVNRVGENQ